MELEQLSSIAFSKYYEPFNISLPEWTSIWWKWFHSIPRDRNPAADTTGKYCRLYQENPDVWFLAGTLGGSAIRNCKIPFGKALFLPIITSVFSYVLDPHLKSIEELTKAVEKDIDTSDCLSFTLDNKYIVNLDQLRIKSKPFDEIIDGVRTTSVSDGFWIFLKPLSEGNHIIQFSGKNIDFFNEVTYHLSVIPPCMQLRQFKISGGH